MNNSNKLFFYTNKSSVWLIFRLLFWVLLFDFILILTFSIFDYVSLEKYIIFSGMSFDEHIIILLLWLHLVLFISLFTVWFFDYYKISSEKVEHNKGVFFKKKQLFIIDKIDSITLNQSVIWRILDYWDIGFYYNEKEFYLRSVPYPEEFIEFLDLFKSKTNKINT